MLLELCQVPSSHLHSRATRCTTGYLLSTHLTRREHGRPRQAEGRPAGCPSATPLLPSVPPAPQQVYVLGSCQSLCTTPLAQRCARDPSCLAPSRLASPTQLGGTWKGQGWVNLKGRRAPSPPMIFTVMSGIWRLRPSRCGPQLPILSNGEVSRILLP